MKIQLYINNVQNRFVHTDIIGGNIGVSTIIFANSQAGDNVVGFLSVYPLVGHGVHSSLG